MGFQTRFWGNQAWSFLHSISLNFPVNPTAADKRRYMAFFKSLEDVLPCRSCRESYGKFIRRKGSTQLTTATMESRESVAIWLYHVHDAVNKRIGKKTSVSFETMCRRYERLRASSCSKHTCDAQQAAKRKRAVVLVMNDETYAKLGFRNSMVMLD